MSGTIQASAFDFYEPPPRTGSKRTRPTIDTSCEGLPDDSVPAEWLATVPAFYALVDKNGPVWIDRFGVNRGHCWDWCGPVNNDGYGHWKAGPGRFRDIPCHKFSYVIARGRMLPKMRDGQLLQVGHLCERRPCVNPDHLLDQTPKENQDYAAAQRAAGVPLPKTAHAEKRGRSVCPKGHPQTEDNRHRNTGPGEGGARCEACLRITRLNGRRERKGLPRLTVEEEDRVADKIFGVGWRGLVT